MMTYVSMNKWIPPSFELNGPKSLLKYWRCNGLLLPKPPKYQTVVSDLVFDPHLRVHHSATIRDHDPIGAGTKAARIQME